MKKKNRRKKWIWQNFLVTQSSWALGGAIFALVQAKQWAKVGSAKIHPYVSILEGGRERMIKAKNNPQQNYLFNSN